MDPVTIATVGAPVVGGLLNMLGQGSANRANREIAREQMRFQERMSSTAYSRAVTDMRRAGLNPALAYSQGGASTPGGASAVMGNVAAGAESSANSAIAAAIQRKNMTLLNEQVRKAKSEAKTAAHEASIRSRDADDRTARWLYYFDHHGNAKPPLQELLRAEHGAKIAHSARSISEAELANLSIPERKAIAELFDKFGKEGKGMQLLMPLLMQIIRSK